MFRCDRYSQHVFLPSSDNDGQWGAGAAEPVLLCLTCWQTHLPTMPTPELLEGLRVLVTWLRDYPTVERGRGGAIASMLALPTSSYGPILLDIALRCGRRGCALDRRPPSKPLPPPTQNSQRSATQSLVSSLASATGELWAAFTDALQVCDFASGGPDTGGLGPTLLGAATMGEGTDNSSPQPSPPSSCRAGSGEGSVVYFMIRLLDLYRSVLRDGQRVEVTVLSAILADFFEQSSPALQAVASNASLLGNVLYGVFAGSALLRQSGRTVEASLFLLHHVFAESRRTPQGLELLAGALVGGVDGAVRRSFGSVLTIALERYSEDETVVTNALTVMHHLLGCATTASHVLRGGTDGGEAGGEWGGGSTEAKDLVRAQAAACPMDEGVSPSVTHSLVKAVAPFILSASEAISALACDVVRLALDTLRTSAGAGAAGAVMLSWVADYTAEGMLVASERSVLAAVALMDEVALSTTHPHGAEASDAAMVRPGAGRERLLAYAHVATLSPVALERAMDGPYLRWLLTSAGLPLEETAHFASRLLSPVVPSSMAVDEVEGGGAALSGSPHPSLGLYGVVSLSELLALAAGEDGADVLPAECVAAVAHAVLTQLGSITGLHLGDRLGAGQMARDPHGGEAVADIRLSEELNAQTLRKLLTVIGFFLPRAPELSAVGLLALADFSNQSARGVEDVSTVSAHLRIATALLCGDGIAHSCRAFPQLAVLARAGVLDQLLAASAKAPAASRERGALEGLCVSFVKALAGDAQGESTVPSLRGSCTVEEVLMRCLSPAAVHPSVAVLGGRLLVRVAALGCTAAMGEAELVEATHRAFGTLCGLMESYAQANLIDSLDESEESVRKGGDTSESYEEMAAAALAHVIRLCLVHVHWFGRAPQGPAEAVHVGNSRESAAATFTALAPLCASPSLRRHIAAALDALVATTEPPMPRIDAVLLSLVTEPWLSSLAVHACLAGLIGELEAGEQRDRHDSSCRRSAEGPWGQLLAAAARAGAGDGLLRGIFAVVQRMVRSPRSRRAHGAGCLSIRLISFVGEWLRQWTLGATCRLESTGSVVAPYKPRDVALCLLSRHCPPFLLSWGTYVDSDSTAELACAVARMLVASLSVVGPADGSGSDGIVVRWCLRELLRDDGLSQHILQLLCLLLERSHGAEIARVYGASVLLPLTQKVSTTDAAHLGCYAVRAVLAGVVRHLLASRAPKGASEWRRWCEYAPIRYLVAHSPASCGGLDAEGPLLSSWGGRRNLTVRACEFFLYGPLMGLRGGGHGIPTVAAATVSDEELADVHTLLDWCMEMMMSPCTDDLRCRDSACRVLCTVVCAYRELLYNSLRLAALYAMCGRETELLPLVPRGWVLASLLFVAPMVPWDTRAADTLLPQEGIAELVRRFLSTLDRPAVPPEGMPCTTTCLGADWEAECGDMLAALTSGCQYFTAAVPGAPPFPQHRVKDFFSSHIAGGAPAGSGQMRNWFLVQNELNLILTS